MFELETETKTVNLIFL